MRPILVVNPPGDDDFADLAHRLVAEGNFGPADLERDLRERYPKASVRERALAGERTVTWYVYREGAWVSEALPAIAEDVKATAADIATVAHRVQEIETEKVRLAPDDERLVELAKESESRTAEMLAKAKSETALAEEAVAEARGTAGDESEPSA